MERSGNRSILTGGEMGWPAPQGDLISFNVRPLRALCCHAINETVIEVCVRLCVPVYSPIS